MLESERVERVVPALDESGLAVRPALEFFFFFTSSYSLKSGAGEENRIRNLPLPFPCICLSDLHNHLLRTVYIAPLFRLLANTCPGKQEASIFLSTCPHTVKAERGWS